ncbi:hypothetical protein F4808DRAFT_437581 [Astrocystis sublimbata]|nr:hypothetical protein F4808DRAFT_437581 [Astrocystis sublimbata]
MCTIVTGGAGFIGCHLVDNLLTAGKRVVVIDSLWTGSSKNTERFEHDPNFRFIKQDVREQLPAIDDVLEIYHLACPASPDYFDSHSVEILETCFVGAKNVLDFAVTNKAKVLIASTSEIYGDPKVVPQPEDYWGNTNSFGPRSCYDEGKRITEALAYSYQKRHNLEVRVARIFNAYGPRMQARDGRAVPNFITAAIQGQPLTIYGDGSATRSFQFVSDCVLGLVQLMQSDYPKPVNIGSDQETRIDEIASRIKTLVADKMGVVSTSPINLVPARIDDPYRRKPDISVAKEMLKWEPTVSLNDGLEATVQWFLENRD